LFFEWTDTDEKEISVHISDSEDEDLDEYEGKELLAILWYREHIIFLRLTFYSIEPSCSNFN
jgi:hypothetical protein